MCVAAFANYSAAFAKITALPSLPSLLPLLLPIVAFAAFDTSHPQLKTKKKPSHSGWVSLLLGVGFSHLLSEDASTLLTPPTMPRSGTSNVRCQSHQSLTTMLSNHLALQNGEGAFAPSN
jgi:hypothetical protein